MAAEDYMVSCLNKKLFGIECFGCGAQRALLLLLEGKFEEAFHLFPAVYTLLLFLVVIIVNLVDRKRNYTSSLIILAVINVVIMVVSYFIRNGNPFL
ncbi:MAG: DUF2752 domain-containing protein [Weeksellaceae bacterium]|nr:DUF2752 domain-containing protein [Weeksellaceae bacterium]